MSKYKYKIGTKVEFSYINDFFKVNIPNVKGTIAFRKKHKGNLYFIDLDETLFFNNNFVTETFVLEEDIIKIISNDIS